jgi:hypothetical protein
LRSRDADQRTEQALAHGVQFQPPIDLAPTGDHAAVLNHDETRRANRLSVVACTCKRTHRPARLVGCDTLPLLRGPRLTLHDGRCEKRGFVESQMDERKNQKAAAFERQDASSFVNLIPARRCVVRSACNGSEEATLTEGCSFAGHYLRFTKQHFVERLGRLGNSRLSTA